MKKNIIKLHLHLLNVNQITIKLQITFNNELNAFVPNYVRFTCKFVFCQQEL